MARHARFVLPGIPLHVIQRGNNRGACFFSDGDRLRYLTLLGDLALKFDCAIHAYVLMDNHVHLLLTPRDVNSASFLMRRLGQHYVQHVNRVHERTGSLWEGRFRSSLVDTDSYFMTCQRYIEMNPVRAGMVPTPADYAWSTFGVNAFGRPDTLITPHPQYLALATDDSTRYAAYRQLFFDELDQKTLDRIRCAANGGYPLGSATFVREVELQLGRSATPRDRGRPAKRAAAG